MTVLKIDDLTYTLPNGRVLYDRLSFEAGISSGLLVYGPTGSGKSTLVKLLLGIINKYQGSIEIMDNQISKLNITKRAELRKKIGFQMSDPIVFEDRNLLDNIGLYLKIAGRKSRKADIITNLYDNGFTGQAGKKIGRLSWGEIRMIEMIRIIMKAPRLVICDQPFTGLDQEKMIWLAEKLIALVNAGSTVLLTFSMPEVRDILDWPEIRLEG